MANNELRISTDNNNNGIKISVSASKNSDADIKINNNNVEYYEKQAAKYSAQTKEHVKDCEKYASEAQSFANDCRNITEELKQSFDSDLDVHINDTDNPHKVTAEQLEVYTKTEADAKYLTEHQDISGKVNKSDLAQVATSGSYKDLSDKPIIPDGAVIDSELSWTSNNSVANSVITNALDKKQDKISDIDTIRAGANAGALALQNIPDEYITETELTQKGYLTQIPDTYALKTDIPDLSNKQDKLKAGVNITISSDNIISTTVDKIADRYSDNPISNYAVCDNFIKKDYSNVKIPYISPDSKIDVLTGPDTGYIYIPYLLSTADGYPTLIQWGTVRNAATIAKTSHWVNKVTLPKDYNTNTDYAIYLTCIGDGTANKILSVHCQTKEPDSFTFDMYNQTAAALKAGVQVSWFTIGLVYDVDGIIEM